DWQIEPDQYSRSGRQLAELTRNDFGGFSHHFSSARPAKGSSNAREQETHVVVDLCGGTNRRSGISDAVLLADCNGRRDSFDPIDVRFLPPLQELPGVR